MFKEIGYACTRHNVDDYGPHYFTTQDEPYIEYKAKDKNVFEMIHFDIWKKLVWVKAGTEEQPISPSFEIQKYVTLTPCPLDMKEVKAIYLQCRELGWI